MAAIESSLRRRMAALESECETLASAVDRLSVQLQEAYQLLQKYEPDTVAVKMGLTPQSAPVDLPQETLSTKL